MSELKKLSEVVFEHLPFSERVAYLKNSLTTTAPTFHIPEPALKKSWLSHHLANRPLLTWLGFAALLGAGVWASYSAADYPMWIAIVLGSLILAGLVLYIIFREKVNAHFKERNDRLVERYAQQHQERMTEYHEQVAEHDTALAEYNARELTYEQAAETVDDLLHMNGIDLCQKLLGVEEEELIALHHIVKPIAEGTKKTYEDQVVHSSYVVQYICMTDKELYEINGEIDVLSGEIVDYASSRILFSKIKSCDVRSNDHFSLNFYAITTTNNDGSASDAMYIPNRRLRPKIGYYIDSVAWEKVNNKDPQYNRIVEGRRSVKGYLGKRLAFDEYEEAVRQINNHRSKSFKSHKDSPQTEKDIMNYEYVQQIIERAVKRKIRETTM